MDFINLLAQAAQTSQEAAESIVPIDLIWQHITSLSKLEALTFISFGSVCLLYGWRVFKILVVISFAAIGLVLGLIPLLVYDRTDSAGLALAIVAASWLIGFLMASTYGYQANGEGVTKRFLWWKRTVRWTDVADFEFRKSPGRSKTPKWVLRDAEGVKLIDITLDLGPNSEKLAVESLVWTNLALTLPPEKLQRPWLARSGIPTSHRT